MAVNLPAASSYQALLQTLQTWRTTLGQVLNSASVPSIPWNFRLTQIRGGLQLDWAAVKGADGYQLLRSATGDMSSPTVIVLGSPQQTTYVDTFANPTKMYYKIQATAGTQSQPHSVIGNPSGVVSGTSIDASNTTTTPTTVYDNTTNQKSQTKGSSGNYNNFADKGL